MRLVIIGGTETGRQIEIGAEELFIGRSSGVGLTLEGANVSRRHSRLWLEQGRLHIEDLGSSNGTFVNGKRVTETKLEDGCEVRFGRANYVYRAPHPETMEEAQGDESQRPQ